MRRLRPTFLLISLLAAPLAAQDPLAEGLRQRLESPDGLRVAGEDLIAQRALPQFYEQRLYAPAWLDQGRPSQRAAELRRAVLDSRLHGLDPNDYRADRLDQIAVAATQRGPAPAVLVDFDLLHTDAFLILAAHLINGRIHPETLNAEWVAVRREVDLVALLTDAVADDTVPEALDGLSPEAPAYDRLVTALADYRQLAADGGWPLISGGATLEPGMTDPVIPAIAYRLLATSDLTVNVPGDLYDDELVAAVKRFQQRHGLEPDGKIGVRTREAMNVPAAHRARQIELNLVRWRWLSRELGERHVLVNIPAFGLRAVDRSGNDLEMRVIVGLPYRRTPVFSDLIRYLVVNPYWEVPRSIAVQDKLPEVQKDPSYFTRQRIRVYNGWGTDERAIDPASIDWTQVSRSSFSYRLRQDPGPINALGRIKFMFPNRFNVYLHDTPTRALFDSADRDLSSGCIRVQRPMDLAHWLLADDQTWSAEALERAVASGRTQTVALPELIPVHVQYWTAWVDDDGSVQFRRDVYGRDARLDEALRTRKRAITSPSAP